jgi:hypothetical protein
VFFRAIVEQGPLKGINDWIGRRCQRDSAFGDLFLAAVQVLLHFVSKKLVLPLATLGNHLIVARYSDLGTEIAGLNRANMRAEDSHFEDQLFGVGVDGMLAR